MAALNRQCPERAQGRPGRIGAAVMRISRVTVGFSLAVGISLVPLAARAQPGGKVPRVGVLEPSRAPGGGCLTGFRRGLQDLGYVEGQTIAIDYRFGDGDPARTSSGTPIQMR